MCFETAVKSWHPTSCLIATVSNTLAAMQLKLLYDQFTIFSLIEGCRTYKRTLSERDKQSLTPVKKKETKSISAATGMWPIVFHVTFVTYSIHFVVTYAISNPW